MPVKEEQSRMIPLNMTNAGESDLIFHCIERKKEQVIQKLKEKKYRITRQRQMLLDVILQEECSSCKEIYYKARKEDAGIGKATVYRMINLLEEIGAISRKNMYQVSCCENFGRQQICVIELDDGTVCRLPLQRWFEVVLEGMKACGYAGKQQVIRITVKSCGEADG